MSWEHVASKRNLQCPRSRGRNPGHRTRRSRSRCTRCRCRSPTTGAQGRWSRRSRCRRRQTRGWRTFCTVHKNTSPDHPKLSSPKPKPRPAFVRTHACKAADTHAQPAHAASRQPPASRRPLPPAWSPRRLCGAAAPFWMAKSPAGETFSAQCSIFVKTRFSSPGLALRPERCR